MAIFIFHFTNFKTITDPKCLICCFRVRKMESTCMHFLKIKIKVLKLIRFFLFIKIIPFMFQHLRNKLNKNLLMALYIVTYFFFSEQVVYFLNLKNKEHLYESRFYVKCHKIIEEIIISHFRNSF